MQIYRNLKIIKAISFDLDDTLYDNKPVIQNVERKMIEWLHSYHPISASITVDHWHAIKQQLLTINPEIRHNVTLWRMKQIEHGLIHLGYQKQKAIQAAQIGMKHALWLRNQVDVPAETHLIMEKLSAQYPLIAITNGNVDPHAIGLGHYFHFILKAGIDGRSKPYPDMFERAIDKLAIPAEQILHVGDHLISDVLGAKNMKLQSCWLNNSGKDIREFNHVNTLPDIEIRRLSELAYLV